MQQDINLYRLLPESQKTFLTLKRVMWSYGILVAFLALSFCFEWRSKQGEKNQAQALQLELSQVELRLLAIQARYPMIDLNDIEASLKKLQQGLMEENKLLNLLSKSRNFSTYLHGVAKASVEGLWLVDIQASLGDQSIVLKGYASQAKSIQEFMNNLAQQKEFQDVHFQLQEVTKTKLHEEILLSFIISTGIKNTA